MKVRQINQKLQKLPLPKVLETKEVSVLWCDDGWAYIPQKGIRRKFSKEDDNSDLMDYVEEKWPGLVPARIYYDEKVMYTTFVGKSNMWMESTFDYKELFVVEAP